MKTALIGYTGFVGGNLNNQFPFDERYNTSNIDEIDGGEFETVVSAATKADMWRINKDDETRAEDLAEIEGLIAHLKTIQAKHFVLISTVGVFKNAAGADEETPLDPEGMVAYGANRIVLEEFVRNAGNFESFLIVRLPGLFGSGLKKNQIYDMLHPVEQAEMIQNLHPDSRYQYYNLGRLWGDIQTALKADLTVVNFAVEPITLREVAGSVDFDGFKPREGLNPANWDMHTRYAEVFGGKNPYMINKATELDEIKTFAEQERSAK
jgi:hypothetical protein